MWLGRFFLFVFLANLRLLKKRITVLAHIEGGPGGFVAVVVMSLAPWVVLVHHSQGVHHAVCLFGVCESNDAFLRCMF